MSATLDLLESFHAPVRDWFRAAFPGSEPTAAQVAGWQAIRAGGSVLILAPTGSGKTLAAFLVAIDELMFGAEEERVDATRVIYVSPLKALATDIERNLQGPIAGIARTAGRASVEHSIPRIAMRTGDTPARERARMLRSPPDILITTPESLYLLLTSRAREGLRRVDTVIIDEIHALAGTKRGAHLALSLERLEELRDRGAAPLRRIGLSATQRPLDEVARFLGGGAIDASGRWTARPVAVADAGSKRSIEVAVEVPVDDLAACIGDEVEQPGADSPYPEAAERSIWPSIHARIIELVRSHRSTMVFVNSRRLAERLAAALNNRAGEEIALAHHGSLAREERSAIEEKLKRGDLPAMVATSSMELGIDIGFVDLVVQVEAPPSVASGLQRIGRANHSVGAVPHGVVLPKHRGDLLASVAGAAAMREGDVEPTRYPRNPLDVLAQHLVAAASVEAWSVDHLFELVRRAAPFAELSRLAFESVLDMLSGRYPSDDFGELRARLTWDRTGGTVRARQGAHRVAVANAGTIPDRGLYGVFLAEKGGAPARRVGELDEEMVFETTAGDVILLGASSWRVEEITHDRVLVSPAPGEPGRMPFWRGDRPGRPLAFGERIGRLARELSERSREAAASMLRTAHGLDDRASRSVAGYVHDQLEASGVVPSDRTIVIEYFPDEAGDWRVCLLSPFGAAIHAPWATAVQARVEAESALRIDAISSDDGIVFRLPATGRPPNLRAFLLDRCEVEELVTRRLASTTLFAARFRENASRALLLPRRRPGRRNPLWLQRKRAADLLAVASRFRSFPVVLETFRDCLRDVFDLPGFGEILRAIASGEIRVVTSERRSASPFASSLLFSYVGNFMYEGDAPIAERRARALAIDHAQLRDILGETELRELFDEELIAETERALQHQTPSRLARHIDALHDLLLALGDLSYDEILARTSHQGSRREWLDQLEREGRIVSCELAREKRWVAVEDAARYRDAFDIALPPGLPPSLLEQVEHSELEIVSRYARTHGPFTRREIEIRYGFSGDVIEECLRALEERGRVVRGAFLPNGRDEEWCDLDVLQTLKRRALGRLRAEIEPVEPEVLARFELEWQRVGENTTGVEGLLAVLLQLQGCPLLASTVETDILPARIADYAPGLLDALSASGEVLWRGIEGVGPADGRIAFYRREEYALLAPPPRRADGEFAEAIRAYLAANGASFFPAMARAVGGFGDDILRALWDLVWAGELTNDTLAPLRAVLQAADPDVKKRRSRAAARAPGRKLALGPPGSEGRWSLLDEAERPSETERRTALARSLLDRYGIVTREAVQAEGLAGGFSAVYPVLRAMEEAGRIRRGYFVAGLGATQFAPAGAAELLRSLRETRRKPRRVVLSASDPANVWGAALPWPRSERARLERRAGARVFLVDGVLAAYLPRTERDLVTFLPECEPNRGAVARSLAASLADLVHEDTRPALLIPSIDGAPPAQSPLAPYLEDAGFRPGASGYLKSARHVSGRRDA